MPRIDSNYQKLGQGKESVPLESGLADTLILDFWLSNWERIDLFFKLPSLWYIATTAQETNTVVLFQEFCKFLFCFVLIPLLHRISNTE